MSKIKTNVIESLDGTKAVNVKDIATTSGGGLGLGMSGETWVDETANRLKNVEYTNDTGKPIMVICVIYTCNSGCTAIVTVGGKEILATNGKYSSGNIDVSFIVPAGETYKYSGTSSNARKWYELK